MSTTCGFATANTNGMPVMANRPVSRRGMLQAALGMAAATVVARPLQTGREGFGLAGLMGAGGVAEAAAAPANQGGYTAAQLAGLKPATEVMRIDPALRYQTVEGWGTSLAWWANAIGGWSDTARNAIADAVFHPTTGLGLNVVRYNIGGGDDPTHDHMRPGAAVPGYQPSPGVWDWTADANQRWMLLAARERGANAFEAFSNSAPYWMTRSGCVSGMDDGSNNLHDAHIDDFASYLAEVVVHFRNEWGLTFQTVEPFNEPSADYWRRFHNQEGCHVSRAQQRAVIARLAAQLAARGVTKTTIAASDEYSFADMVKTVAAYDRPTPSHVSRFNTHSYSGFQRADVRARVAATGKGLWMSEFGTGKGPHSHQAMASALALAAQIRRDMTELQPTAWVYWQAVEHEGKNNWGFIHADLTGKSEHYWLTKQYYAMAHYSRFIRPRYQLLGVGANKALAAYDHAAGTLVIVHDNSAAHDMPVRFDLSRFSHVPASAIAYRTSPSENLARTTDIPLAQKALATIAPAQSITTYVVNGIEQ